MKLGIVGLPNVGKSRTGFSFPTGRGDENYQIPFGQYSLRLISNAAVVAVFGRLDRRKDCAYYEIDGFCM